MPRISRYLLREDDRTGFKQFAIQLIKDGPWKVMPEEFDTPPPSRLPLGGEGDVARGDQRASSSGLSSTDTPSTSDNPVVYVLAAGGITPVFTSPWMRVSGSNGAVTITAVPQIVRGMERQVLTLQCVDSSLTLAHGSANAINFMDSRSTLQLASGMVLTIVFNTANQAWNEASRFRP